MNKDDSRDELSKGFSLEQKIICLVAAKGT